MNSQVLKRQLHMAVARATQRMGAVGWLGLALCVVALSWLTWGWTSRVQAEPRVAPVVLSTSAQPAPAVQSVPALPAREDMPLLLTQVQQIAVTQGLAWTAADYKLLPASDAAPLSLEVRCGLKGPYVKLRQAIAQWQAAVPGLAIRDLAMNRPNSDALEVDAKLVLVIFMHDPSAAPSVAGSKP